MSGPATFSAASYDLPLRDGGVASLGAMPSGETARLGDAIGQMDPWRTYGYPASALTRMLAMVEPGAPRFAFFLDDCVVGAAVIRAAWLRGPYLQFLALLPEAQGRGVGTAFMAFMEREARAAEERNLWVAASEINDGAIRFYERHGFVRVAALDGLAYDDRVEFLLRKRLA